MTYYVLNTDNHVVSVHRAKALADTAAIAFARLVPPGRADVWEFRDSPMLPKGADANHLAGTCLTTVLVTRRTGAELIRVLA